MAFVLAGKTGDIAAGSIHEVNVGGTVVAVANVAGTLHAISNTCLHRGGPLGQGALDGTTVTCPWHAWQFDVITGKVGQNPTVGVACYPVEVKGDDFYVDLG
jgi:nitrite reductase/ring-hydroxylating ferredoxin subunit